MDEKDMSFEELERQWNPLIIKFSTKYVIPGYDVDDIKQELRMVLLRAQQLYDPNKGTKFMTYLYNAFDSKLKQLYRDVQGRKKHVPNNLVSYIHEKNYKEPYDVENYDDINLFAGLDYPSKRLGEMIVSGTTRFGDWLESGMTRKEIRHGKERLKLALEQGRN